MLCSIFETGFCLLKIQLRGLEKAMKTNRRKEALKDFFFLQNWDKTFFLFEMQENFNCANFGTKPFLKV